MDAGLRSMARTTIKNEGGAPLDRKAFFKQQQERKWNGIKRCC